MAIIYKSTNKVNGKVYIGYTNKPLSKRIIEHKCSANKGSKYLFHKAIRKHGIENFVWEPIFESNDVETTLELMEGQFIKEYDCYYETGKGYNMTFGGQGGMFNKTHSEETKRKMKLAWTKRTNRVCNPNGIPREGVLKSAENRRGKPSWNKGKICSNISENNFGHKCKGKSWYKDINTGKRVWV